MVVDEAHAVGAGERRRHRDLGDRLRLRVDAEQVAGVELVDVERAVAVGDDAVEAERALRRGHEPRVLHERLELAVRDAQHVAAERVGRVERVAVEHEVVAELRRAERVGRVRRAVEPERTDLRRVLERRVDRAQPQLVVVDQDAGLAEDVGTGRDHRVRVGLAVVERDDLAGRQRPDVERAVGVGGQALGVVGGAGEGERVGLGRRVVGASDERGREGEGSEEFRHGRQPRQHRVLS